MIITEKELNDILGMTIKVHFSCSSIGLIDSKKSETLSYVSSEEYIEHVNNNININTVFSSAELEPYIKKKVIIVDDPVWAFWTLYNFLSVKEKERSIEKNYINNSAKIHSTSYIAKHNISIGHNTIIEPNVTIHSGVTIGNNCIIRSGTVCGFDGFEHKRTKKGILSICHSGKVVIHDDVEIGSLNSIAKGLSWGNTVIGCGTKTDSLVHIAHSVSIGKRCLIAACTEISGSVDVGNDCWLGPNCSIINGISLGEKVFIGIGAVVTKSFPDHAVVAGNPAKLLRISIKKDS